MLNEAILPPGEKNAAQPNGSAGYWGHGTQVGSGYAAIVGIP